MTPVFFFTPPPHTRLCTRSVIGRDHRGPSRRNHRELPVFPSGKARCHREVPFFARLLCRGRGGGDREYAALVFPRGKARCHREYPVFARLLGRGCGGGDREYAEPRRRWRPPTSRPRCARSRVRPGRTTPFLLLPLVHRRTVALAVALDHAIALAATIASLSPELHIEAADNR